jgi:putative Holliday junction resolvase
VERQIGVAVSDPSGTIARPLRTLRRRSRLEDFDSIRSLVAEYGATLVVVGKPLSLNGSLGPQARRIGRYADKLSAHLAVPVQAWDERYSTVVARNILDRRRKRDNRQSGSRGGIDAVAAAVILQSYLDSRHALGQAVTDHP